jgi:hypothetical protein
VESKIGFKCQINWKIAIGNDHESSHKYFGKHVRDQEFR